MGVVVWLQNCLSGVTFINESHEVPTGKLFLLLLLSLFLSLSLSHDLCSRTHKCTLSSSHTQIHSLSLILHTRVKFQLHSLEVIPWHKKLEPVELENSDETNPLPGEKKV